MRNIKKELDNTLKEIDEFLFNKKTIEEQQKHRKKQLNYLKADLKRSKIPFKHGLKLVDHKRTKKKAYREKRADLGFKK